MAACIAPEPYALSESGDVIERHAFPGVVPGYRVPAHPCLFQILRDKIILVTDNSSMSNLLPLARKFELFTADAVNLSERATALASTSSTDKAEIALEIARVADTMAAISTHLTKALNAARSKPRSKAA